MKTADIESVANRQSHRCYASILMDISNMMNTRTTQRRRCYAGIPMNTSITTNVLISQLGTSCAFDSPGLARNEPTPGKRSQGDSTP
ncbi:MAG: tetrahydrofolate synthase [Prevotella salivae]|nr:tetrahydrofolate synthase [Segatella salivae]